MLAQRIYGLALGYEDLNDHEQLRLDPLLQLLAGKQEPGAESLAGKSTLSRMELGDGLPSRYKKITFWRDAIDDVLVDVFLDPTPQLPSRWCSRESCSLPQSERRRSGLPGATIRAESFTGADGVTIRMFSSRASRVGLRLIVGRWRERA
jgi:hypothetical protein